MMLNYTNILLFYLSLNILSSSSEVYNQRNHYITRTQKATTRTLCECELYAPSNYDNDPEMKAVMQGFDRQTSQRFEEYNERMNDKRQKCKEQCEKDIQKIILKDKIEKELAEKFVTLQTDIQSDAIPTCVCEKSLADKTEKFCHNCGYGLGSVAPNIGLLGGPGIYVWKIAALATAKELAEKAGAAAGEAAGHAAGAAKVIDLVKSTFNVQNIAGQPLELVFTKQNYTNVSEISKSIYMEYSSCLPSVSSARGDLSKPICSTVDALVSPQGTNSHTPASTNAVIKEHVASIVSQAKDTAEMAVQKVTEDATSLAMETNTAAVNATYANSQIAIIASIVAILVIVLVMIIIYLILRYRRKKKMKKKLQYIKLLKE